MKSTVSALALLLFLLPVPGARGESAIQCHCFQDRSFDPGAPGKVEPYLLATAQNSFLSAFFWVDKTQIVRRRMSGTGADDLWIAFYVGKKKGVDPAGLLAGRAAEGSWKTALLKGGVRPTDLDAPVKAAMVGGNDRALAVAIADDSLSRALGVKRPDLAALRARGATTQELLLAAFLGNRSGRPAEALWHDVKGGKTSWGLLAANLGVRIGEMEKEFARILRKS